MGEQVNPDAYTQTLLPRGLLPGPLTRRVSVGSDQKGYLFDFKPAGNLHPYLELFRGEEKSGLDTAQVFTYIQLQLPRDTKAERILNYVPTGDPAITVHSLGAGRVVYFSTTANADWTTLPVKLVYVSLMHELGAHSVPPGDAWMNLLVGQSLELPPNLRLTSAPTLTTPGRSAITMTAATGQTYRSPPLTAPGVYTLTAGDRTYPISVNVPADESDIRVMDQAAVRAALGDVQLQFDTDQLPPPQVAQAEGRDFGWSVMLAVLALLGAECFMAMRFGHHRR
jgi:hypothetical protein